MGLFTWRIRNSSGLGWLRLCQSRLLIRLHVHTAKESRVGSPVLRSRTAGSAGHRPGQSAISCHPRAETVLDAPRFRESRRLCQVFPDTVCPALPDKEIDGV